MQANNPAGLANLTGTQAQLGANLYFVDGRLRNDGTTSLLGTPLASSSAALTATMPAPYIYASHQFTPALTGGFAVDTQIGLSTHYPDSWFGRYFALNTDLKTIDLSPNLAYKLTDALAIGGGFVARYSQARLTQAIDLGAIGFASRIPGSIPEAQDGIARLDASDWGYGFKLGADWHVTPATELGLSFRSQLETTVAGTAKFALSPVGQFLSGATGALVNTGVRTRIVDPASINFSLSQILTPELTAYADVDWINWAAFKQLTITFANPLQAPTVLPGNWRNSWKIAAGLDYKLTAGLVLRGGMAWEESPVPDAAHRTPDLPDGNRIWLSAGVGWSVLPGTQVNLGYAHLFVADGGLVNTQAAAGTLRATTQDLHAHIATLDLLCTF